MATDVSAPFVWGGGGSQLTPDQIAAQRKIAQAMMEKGSDYSPVQSWTQGAARVAQAIFGGMQARDANEAAKTNADAETKLIFDAFGGGSATPTATPAAAPSTAPTIADPGLTDAITKVAAARGVDPQYMTRLAAVESGGDVNAANPNSSARGPFQFINSTARQYGLSNPTDPSASADAAARLTLDNKAALTSALGREPTPGELYLAHQQGAGGAAKLLANPNAPVEGVIGPEAARLNGAAPGMTAGQFANKWTGRFSDIGSAQPAATPAAASMPAATAPAAAPASPALAGVNPALIRAMSSPYVSAGTKQILGLVLNQQMTAAKNAADPLRQLQIQEAQTKLAPVGQPYKDNDGNLVQRDALGKVTILSAADKTAARNAADPLRQLQMQKTQAEIDKLQGKNPGPTEYGLNPIYGKDPATGKQVLGTLGKDGTFKKIDTGGIEVSSGIEKLDLGTHFAVYDKKSGQFLGNQPKDLRGAAAEKALGTAQGTVQASLPSDLQTANSTIKEIDKLISNPGLGSIVGPLDQFRPSWTMGAEGRDALARYNQLKGKAFLQAYSTLRGGGQVTEVEGTKAENAMARMDRAQSEDDFKAALTDFRDAVKTGMDKLREKAGIAAPGGTTAGGLSWSVE